MDVSLWAIVGPLIVIVAGYAFVWILKRRRDHEFFQRHGIPGPPPGLVYGNWDQLREDRLLVMDQWIQKYGKVFGFYMAEIPYMVVSDVDMVKQCLIKEAHLFRDRPRAIIDVEPFRSSLLFLRGDEWKKVRTVLNPSFTAAKMKLLTNVMHQCSDVMLNLLDESVSKGEVIDMFKVSQGLSMDVISKCALAWQVDCQKNPNDPLLKSLQKVFEDTDGTVVKNALRIPALRTILKWLFPMSEVGRAISKIMDNLHHIVQLRRSGHSLRSTDMLQLLLDSQKGEGTTSKREVHELLIEDRHLLANSFVFLAGGFETTATSLSFIMYELAKNPLEQERLHTELVDALPGGLDLGYDEVHQLKRLDMVINECLRMYPPIVLFISRTCAQDTTVMGQFFPAGAEVLVPVWNVHHDPDLWPEPFKFDPERFSNGLEGIHPASYMPFGIGPRMCIGRRFALFELKIAVCKIIRKFKILLCRETQDPVKVIVPSVTLNPEKGINLKLEARTV